MQFKTAKFKAGNASNSIAIANFTNVEVGCFECMGGIHKLISDFLKGSIYSLGEQ